MASVRGIKYKVEGAEQLSAQFERIRKLPKKYLTRAAKVGSEGPLKDAKANAPVSKKESRGTLKKSIRRKMETPNKRTKGVYRIWFNGKYADIFRGNKIKRPGLYGANPPRDHGYYPLSVEYGYKAKKGKIQGKMFVSQAIEKNERDSLKKIVDSLNRSITEVIQANEAKAASSGNVAKK